MLIELCTNPIIQNQNMPITRKNSSPTTKRILKEKVVQIYELLFNAEDLVHEKRIFWEELFLLKPKVSYLQNEIMKLSEDQLVTIKPNLSLLFSKCIHILDHPHHIRNLYALQTLCALISSIYKKSNHGNGGSDVINILIDYNIVEKCMYQLFSHCNDFLSGEWPSSLKSICLKLILTIVTGTDNISHNTLIEYLMVDNIFETLIKLLSDITNRSIFGHDVMLLLTLLVNYRKYETSNPYIIKLSILDNETSLNGYGQVIAYSVSNFCNQFINHQPEPHVSSWILSLTHIVGNIFTREENSMCPKKIRENNGVLLALYEIVHLNRNFITVLAHTKGNSTSNNDGVDNNYANEYSAVAVFNNDEKPEDKNSLNLLITVLEYCSMVMQDTQSEECYHSVKLCFLILMCISEDQYANSVMHDFQLLFKVRIFRMPMRHRTTIHDKSAQPLAATLIDLLSEFMMSHLMKKLPAELYELCIGIIHRLICYEKKSNVRLNYNWKELWEVLIILMKFLVSNENHISKKQIIFKLLLQSTNIFNLFITYGDTFLASPRSYDLLYYELIRMHGVFENAYAFAIKYSSVNADYKDIINDVLSSLINIRAIINHFSPKIEKWVEENSASPTENEILEILRLNYDSLTLKLLDGLDQYERYSEKPYHSSFFTLLVRNIIDDSRQNIDFVNLDLQTILKEFASI